MFAKIPWNKERRTGYGKVSGSATPSRRGWTRRGYRIWKGANTRGGYGGRGREVTMQMQEYIYLGTTPMYFLGASGRIVGSESNPHTLGCQPSSHLIPVLFHLPRATIHPRPLSPFSSISISLFTLSWLPLSHLPILSCACTRVPPPRPILWRFTSKLVRSPGLIDRQVMGPIQFNFENKQPPTAMLVNLFRNPVSGSRYTATGNIVEQHILEERKEEQA